MFRRTNSFTARTESGDEIVIEEHTHFQDETPGMKQYRTKIGDSAKRISDDEFEIAGRQGPVRAKVIDSATDD
ncbi:MAG: hypothetical protein MPJ50_17050 [Pirellulales bacterium]|nr:hypothetical protein [Pirellulales bacterium]